MIVLIAFGNSSLYAQTVACEERGASGQQIGCAIPTLTNYRSQSSYSPTATDPLIGVKFVVHVIIPVSNTTALLGNYTQNHSHQYHSHQELVDLFTENVPEAFNHKSDRYSQPRQTYPTNWWPTSAPSTTISDSRVYYEFVNYYYYPSDAMYNLRAAETKTLLDSQGNPVLDSQGNPITYLDFSNENIIYNWLKTNWPDRLKEGIPIISGNSDAPFATIIQDQPVTFVPLRAGVSATQHALFQGLNRSTLRHEMGHIMGWYHNYDGGEAHCPPSEDYLYDVLPVNNETFCNSRTGSCPSMYQQCKNCLECGAYRTNNVMSGVNEWWMSPLQMGRRIRNMHIRSMGWNTSDYAVEAESQHTHPWLITSNETWNFDIQLYRDIVVKSGVTLSITCRVAMAAGGKIIVEKGAKLAINGGTITGWCKKAPVGYGYSMWKGIEIEGSNTNQLIHNVTGYCAGHGIVELIENQTNPSTISNALMGISTGTTDASGNFDFSSQGGIVIATGANFENNVYDIIFNKYQNPFARSILRKCTFHTTSEIGKDGTNTAILPKEHLKLYQNDGLKIEGCTFEHGSGVPYTSQNIEIGIYATDSHFKVDQWCATNQCTTSVRTKFKNLIWGIYIDNVNPLYTAEITNSDFEDCHWFGTLAENCHYLFLHKNSFLITDPYGAAGLYLDRCKYYKIHNNTFEGTSYETGAVSYSSKDGAHEVYRNTFKNLSSGIIAQDNNGGFSAPATGLRMNCNVFNDGVSNSRDIALTRTLTAPLVMWSQGINNQSDPGVWARNLYGAPYIGSGGIGQKNKWWIHSSNNQNIIHPSSDDDVDNPRYPQNQASAQLDVYWHSANFDYTLHCIANPNSTGGNGSSSSDKIANLNNYLTILKGQTSPDRFEVQSAVAGKIHLFASDTSEAARDSVIALFSTNQGDMDDATILEIFALMKAQSFTAATQKVNNLSSSQQDWEDLLSHLITLEQEEDGIFALKQDSAETEFFRNYAETEGKDGQATAQAILRYVFGDTHSYPIVQPELGEGNRISALNSQINEQYPVSIYPNPTSGTLKIAANDKNTHTLHIYDLLGSLIIVDQVSGPGIKELSVQSLPNSIYFCTLSDSSGSILLRQSFIKTD